LFIFFFIFNKIYNGEGKFASKEKKENKRTKAITRKVKEQER